MNTAQLKHFKKFRDELIKNLSNKGISDNEVLEAMRKVPREVFISKDITDKAYLDIALPIEHNQTISQPFTVAYMTQLLDVSTGMKVLEIGTGSGYQAAILYFMGAKVFSIERIAELQNEAVNILDKLSVNIAVKLGDGSLGWVEESPFQRILITAAIPKFPYHLKTQLSDGGIIVCPVGKSDSQVMYKGILINNEFEITKFESFRFVPLIGKYGQHE